MITSARVRNLVSLQDGVKAAFAILGSSRHLVVAADSATAVILAAALTGLAAVGSERYVKLAGLAALLANVVNNLPATLLPVVQEAMDAGMVTPADDAFAFRHALVRRAVAEMKDGDFVNLGIGQPTLVADHLGVQL